MISTAPGGRIRVSQMVRHGLILRVAFRTPWLSMCVAIIGHFAVFSPRAHYLFWKHHPAMRPRWDTSAPPRGVRCVCLESGHSGQGAPSPGRCYSAKGEAAAHSNRGRFAQPGRLVVSVKACALLRVSTVLRRSRTPASPIRRQAEDGTELRLCHRQAQGEQKDARQYKVRRGGTRHICETERLVRRPGLRRVRSSRRMHHMVVLVRANDSASLIDLNARQKQRGPASVRTTEKLPLSGHVICEAGAHVAHGRQHSPLFFRCLAGRTSTGRECLSSGSCTRRRVGSHEQQMQELARYCGIARHTLHDALRVSGVIAKRSWQWNDDAGCVRAFRRRSTTCCMEHDPAAYLWTLYRGNVCFLKQRRQKRFKRGILAALHVYVRDRTSWKAATQLFAGGEFDVANLVPQLLDRLVSGTAAAAQPHHGRQHRSSSIDTTLSLECIRYSEFMYKATQLFSAPLRHSHRWKASCLRFACSRAFEPALGIASLANWDSSIARGSGREITGRSLMPRARSSQVAARLLLPQYRASAGA